MAEECGKVYMEVIYDFAIAKIALQVQATMNPHFNNLYIHFGFFLIMMTHFKAVEKCIDNCGLRNSTVIVK